MRARASGRISRTLVITAAIVILLAGTAWWLLQPDASPDAAGSRWPAYHEPGPAVQDGSGTPSTPEAPTTTGRVTADHKATPAAGTNAAKPEPQSSEVASAAASPDGNPDAGNTLSEWLATNADADDNDADDDEKDELPRHWYPCGTGRMSGVDYLFASDSRTAAKGKHSASVTSLTQNPEPHRRSAAWCQWVHADAFRGKRVAYSAFLRTERAEPGVRLDVRADGPGGRVLANTFSFSDLVPGTTPWTRYTIVIDIPKEARWVQVSAFLAFSGTMWVDDATLEIVDESWPLTQEIRQPVIGGYAPGRQPDEVRGADILNADFEETVPRPTSR